MDKCNNKENEIVKEEHDESYDLIFLLRDSGELYIPFLSCFKLKKQLPESL